VRKVAAIARTGLVAVLLHPLRSGATLLCIVALLAPYVAGAGVARGLADAADASIRAGGDVYVTGLRFGRPAPVPLPLLETVRAVPGVRDVFPRIVGEIALGAERVPAVVVGVPEGRVPPAASRLVEGRLFGAGARNELVLGAELARRLSTRVGDRIPPFYRNRSGERISTVVGVFRADPPSGRRTSSSARLRPRPTSSTRRDSRRASSCAANPGTATRSWLRSAGSRRAGSRRRAARSRPWSRPATTSSRCCRAG
jgi:hypothetical protein